MRLALTMAWRMECFAYTPAPHWLDMYCDGGPLIARAIIEWIQAHTIFGLRTRWHFVVLRVPYWLQATRRLHAEVKMEMHDAEISVDSLIVISHTY